MLLLAHCIEECVCFFSSKKVTAWANARALTIFYSQMLFILHLLRCDFRVLTFEKTLSCIQGSLMKNFQGKAVRNDMPVLDFSHMMSSWEGISLLFPSVGWATSLSLNIFAYRHSLHSKKYGTYSGTRECI